LEVEFGRCPLCGRAMSERVKHVTLRDKILEFPDYLHCCPYHGYFIWRGRKGYELANFSKIEREAISVKPKPPDVKAPYTDYSIVRMKCHIVGLSGNNLKILHLIRGVVSSFAHLVNLKYLRKKLCLNNN
jgi:hypothetical protein